MMCIVATLLVALVTTTLATPIRTRSPYSTKETHILPRGWKSIGRAPPDHVIHLQLAVKQGQFDELDRHLYEGKLIFPGEYN